MTKINYDENGNIIGYYPDNMGYTSIPEPYIVADEATYQDCIDNPGLRRVDTVKKVIMVYTPTAPTPDETKEQKTQDLDNEYQPQFLEITRSWANANMDGNTNLMDSIKTLKSTLIDEYLAKKEEIENA